MKKEKRKTMSEIILEYLRKIGRKDLTVAMSRYESWYMEHMYDMHIPEDIDITYMPARGGKMHLIPKIKIYESAILSQAMKDIKAWNQYIEGIPRKKTLSSYLTRKCDLYRIPIKNSDGTEQGFYYFDESAMLDNMVYDDSFEEMVTDFAIESDPQLIYQLLFLSKHGCARIEGDKEPRSYYKMHKRTTHFYWNNMHPLVINSSLWFEPLFDEISNDIKWCHFTLKSEVVPEVYERAIYKYLINNIDGYLGKMFSFNEALKPYHKTYH